MSLSRILFVLKIIFRLKCHAIKTYQENEEDSVEHERRRAVNDRGFCVVIFVPEEQTTEPVWMLCGREKYLRDVTMIAQTPF